MIDPRKRGCITSSNAPGDQQLDKARNVVLTLVSVAPTYGDATLASDKKSMKVAYKIYLFFLC